MESFNNPEKEFTDIFFVFVDSSNGNVIGIREIPINGQVANYIAYANATYYIFFDKSPYKKSSYRIISELHSDWCKAAAADLEVARNIDFKAMKSAPGIIGIDIDANDSAKFYSF